MWCGGCIEFVRYACTGFLTAWEDCIETLPSPWCSLLWFTLNCTTQWLYQPQVDSFMGMFHAFVCQPWHIKESTGQYTGVRWWHSHACSMYVCTYYDHCTTGQWNHILQYPCWNHAHRYTQINTGGYRSCTPSLTHLPGVQIPLGQPTGIR